MSRSVALKGSPQIRRMASPGNLMKMQIPSSLHPTLAVEWAQLSLF